MDLEEVLVRAELMYQIRQRVYVNQNYIYRSIERGSYYKLNRDGRLQSIRNLMSIGTDTTSPCSDCSDCIAQAFLTSMPPAITSAINMSVDPRYMAIPSGLPPSDRRTAIGTFESIGARGPN